MGLSNPSYFITTKNKKNMENAIIVPFDLNTARKIKSGEIEGSVLIDNIEIEFVSFAISLTEHDIIQLLDDDSREESGSGTYYERECDALFDIDGRGNTERLVARNPN